MAGDRPSGTVTFLFTDIEGSTRLWEERPAEMKPALLRHDAIVRRAIESNAGYVFATGGDGFAAAFHRPDDAVRAAVDGQRGLSSDTRSGVLELRVRMGIHTGVAEERGGDYFGEVPTRTARLMGVGWGGQILCSDATCKLLSGSYGATSLGPHRLRDLAEPLQLWQIPAGESGAFPPLQSLNETPGNLPLLLTPLIGRTSLVAELVGRFAQARLLTLTGIGGVGKTRLALQVAADCGPDSPGGCWLVELAPVRDSDDVAEALIVALGVARRPGMSALESAVDHLRNQELAIVLDNCEHVLDAAGEVASSILRSCTNVRILATSREGLGIAGEQIVAVPSLGVLTKDDGLRTAPAVRLFVERAEALGAWQPADAELEWIGELCRHLDGIPLAIELAAGRAPVLSPQDMVSRLDDRFRVLAGRRGGRLERHQTMRAALEWSYELLTPNERSALDRLGVFVGAFDLESASVVAGDGDDPLAMIDVLSSLIARSLVHLDRSGARQRYRLLETLRQFAVDNLAEAGTIDKVRHRHARHFADRSRRLGASLRGPDEADAREQLMATVSDLRAAVAFAADVDDVELAAALVGPFAGGPFTVVHAIPSLAADVVDMVADDPMWGASVATLAGWDAYLSSDPAAVRLRIDLVRSATGSPDALVASEAWRTLSALEALTGGMKAAAKASARAVELADETDDRFQKINTRCSFAAWRAGFGDPRVDVAEEIVRGARQQQNPWLLGYAMFVAAFAVEMTDPSRALEIADEMAGLRPDPPDAASVAPESVAGRILLSRGHYRTALKRLFIHMEANLRDGIRAEFRYSATAAAGCLAKLGHPQAAAQIFAAHSGGTPWVNQVETEKLVDALLDEVLAPDLRVELTRQGAALEFTDAAELATASVAEVLEEGP